MGEGTKRGRVRYGLETDEQLGIWIERAVKFVEKLPVK